MSGSFTVKFERINIDRRTLLKAAVAAGATGALGVAAFSKDEPQYAEPQLQGAIGKDGQRVQPWRNWSGNQASEPTEWLFPRDVDDLSKMVRGATQRLRLAGTSHSFSGLVPTNESIMSLAYMTGISAIDTATKQFDVAANTFLAAVGEHLWQNGMSLENMPDINTQTFGGAIATSTHGTGVNFGSMSSTVKQVSLINGLGEQLQCSNSQNPELFNAVRNGIGVMGAVTEFKIQAQERYHLKETTWMMDLQEGLDTAEALKNQHRHFELFALPHADYILGVTLDEIDENQLEAPKAHQGDAYETFRTLANIIDTVPALRNFIINKGASTVEKETRTGRSHEIFGNVRDILFNEMEYSVPAEHGIACLKEILDAITKHDIDVIFPLEVRFVKADDVWLSPFYQRESCAISCHNFHDKDYKKYFALIEPIFWKYDGRPHWGKIHTLAAKEQRARYPMFDEFLKVRAAMDPKNLFTNDHINHVLGLG